MRVVLAGASGLIGSRLHTSLRAQRHTVVQLVRREPRNACEFTWDPERHVLDPAALAGAEAVVGLSGAGIADRRWSGEYKQVLRSSRIDPVATLAAAIAELDTPPKIFVTASAVGYYGDGADVVLDESAPAGDTFLARLCLDWEGAAARAGDVPTAHLRTGLVLASDGGLMAKIVPLFKLGLGGRLGSGRQYWPWISIDDVIGAISFVLERGLEEDPIVGPVNLTGPEPVTNAEFTSVLGGLLHRPTLFPAPGFGIKAVLGEFADDVLTGQRAVPTRLLEAGFDFTHPTLEAALRASLA